MVSEEFNVWLLKVECMVSEELNVLWAYTRSRATYRKE